MHFSQTRSKCASETGKVRSDLSLTSFLIFRDFRFFDTISCLSPRQAACFRNNVENGDGTSFASGQIKFQWADALIPMCESERVNSIARERATRHETRTHVLMHARAYAYPHHPGCTSVHYTRRVRGFRNSREKERKRERRKARVENPRRLRRHEGFRVVLKISEHSWGCNPEPHWDTYVMRVSCCLVSTSLESRDLTEMWYIQNFEN